jgi:arylsulfatase
VLGVEFVKEGTGKYREFTGTAKLYVDDKAVAEGPMRAQVGKFTLAGDGLCIGRDSGELEAAGAFARD